MPLSTQHLLAAATAFVPLVAKTERCTVNLYQEKDRRGGTREEQSELCLQPCGSLSAAPAMGPRPHDERSSVPVAHTSFVAGIVHSLVLALPAGRAAVYRAASGAS